MKEKKSVTEVTSFVLLTLLIVVASLGAYNFGQSYIESSLAKFERDRMESNLKKLDYLFDELTGFTNTTRSYPITFEVGLLTFENNQVIYQSEVESSGNDTFCFGRVCSQAVSGYERLLINITENYEFATNESLEPGNYVLIFRHDKQAQEITIGTE